MKISIVVPVLNERAILASSLAHLQAAISGAAAGDWEVVVADAGSTDGSVDLAREWTNRNSGMLVEAPVVKPSVGKTVRAGVLAASGELVVVLPSDCRLTSASLINLNQAIHQGKTSGGFRKQYEPSTMLLSIYAKIQNSIRTARLRHLVWTNAMFFPRSQFIPTTGFLEDVALSDELRKDPHWTLLASPVIVSARRYYPGRVLPRILVNLSIMALYRLGWSGPERLKKLYAAIQ